MKCHGVYTSLLEKDEQPGIMVPAYEWRLITTWMDFQYKPPDASFLSQWQLVICKILCQIRIYIQFRISTTTTSKSSEDVKQELLRLRDDSSHGQAVRRSGSTTGTVHVEALFSGSREPLLDGRMGHQRKHRVIGIVWSRELW